MRSQTLLAATLLVATQTGPFAAPATAQDADLSPDAFPIAAFVDIAPDGLTDDVLAAAAIERAPALVSAEARVVRLDAQRDEIMVGAFPSLSLEASYTRLSAIPDEPLNFGGAEIENPFEAPLNNTSFVAQLTVPVTQAILSVLPGLEAADHAIRAEEIRVELTRRQLDLETRVAFFDYVRLRAQQRVADDAIVQLTALRDDVNALVARELRPSADLAEIEAGIAQAEMQAAQLAGNTELARRALERLTGTDVPATAAIGIAALRMPNIDVPDANAAYRTALETRPELQSIAEARAALEARIRASRAGLYPSVSIIGAAELSNPNARYVPPESEFNESWAVTVAATWSPNGFRAAQHANRQLEADLDVLEADLDAIEDQLFVELQQALTQVEIAERAIVAAAAGVDAAAVAHRAATLRNREGLGTAREVLDTETALRSAQSALVDARLQRRVAAMRLQWSLGQPL